MRDARWAIIVVLVIFAIATGKVNAQPLIAQAESIDSTVINADLVFVAKLIKLGEEAEIDGRKMVHGAIEIERILKQEPYNDEPYTKLQIDLARPKAVLRDWLENSTRLLVTYESYEPGATQAIELVPGKMEILTAEFKLLREPDAVIQAAEEALKRTSPAVQRLHTFRLNVPRDLTVGTKWEKDYALQLTVPVDKQLEKRARKYLHSENYSERREGARALRYFKSDENIAQVKSLLSDHGYGYWQHPLQNNGIEVRHYGVREDAYYTLKFWGVEVEKPVIREEISKPPAKVPQAGSLRR